MKVQGITFLNYKNNINNTSGPRNSAPVRFNNTSDIFVKSYSPAPQNIHSTLNPVSFMGYSVHIVDGGNHAKNMTYFANSLTDKWDIYNKEVETNRRDPNVKQLENLEWKLKELNFANDLSYDEYHDFAYVALPVLATVPLQNLQDQMKAVTGKDIHLTPQNVKTKKNEIIQFLKMLYDHPEQYRKYIDYMDPMGQGIEKTYGVIYQINKINAKPNTKVLVPAGHPEYASIKWITEQRNLKPELHNYIATNEDVNYVIHNVQDEIKNNGWYDFNLLSLSDADVVNLKNEADENYIYSAYDSCITNGGRGVYNFSPVRDENGNLKGYGYHNEQTADYPFEEFPANDEVQNIARFVGRPLDEVLADEKTTQAFKDAVWNNESREPFADKLFKVEDIFPQHERDYNKMSLKGDYIDSSLNLFFRKNNNGQVIFPACDCEGSGRPSVLSMWGSCFSIFNAIKDDINLKERFNERGYFNEETLKTKHPQEINLLLKESEKMLENKNYTEAEHILRYAAELEKTAGLHGHKPLEALGNLYLMQNDYIKAEDCFNSALNELSRHIITKINSINKDLTLAECSTYKNRFENLQNQHMEYIHEKQRYDNLGAIQKMFSTEPQKPEQAEKYRQYALIYDMALEAGQIFRKLADICEKKGEDYPTFACNWAADMMQYPSEGVCFDIIKRRADNNTYLGDFLHVD